jgi:hypothetical protein
MSSKQAKRTRLRLGMLAGVVAVVAFGTYILAREDDRRELACSLVGCTSGIYISNTSAPRESRVLRGATSVRLCVDGRCETNHVRRGELGLFGTEWRGVPKHPNATYAVDLTISDRRGRVLVHAHSAVRLKKEEPNGYECGPTCFIGSLVLEPARQRLRPVRG